MVEHNLPLASEFPAYPESWYLFGAASELGKRPVSRDMLGRTLVAFRTASDRIVVLDGRCSHMGADLGQGKVVADAIQCPFHNWEYGPDGRCTRIPASREIPAFARVRSYPVQERHGLVFFFSGPEAHFPLPFFEEVRPEEFTPARPFGAVLNCPWYMVGANAFDVQHFLGAHDRRLDGIPKVECPAPLARKITLPLVVAGSSWRDRLTRWFGGGRLEMSFTDWCGNLIFATARFRRTTSRGMVLIQPLGPERVLVQVVVFVPRSPGWPGRLLLDPLNRWLRRYFIAKFLQSDAELGARGLRYNPAALIDRDRELAGYFSWLAKVSCGAERAKTESACLEPVPALARAIAPPASRFPTYPASWYLFGESPELRAGPLAKDILGRRLVAFRGAGGQVAILDARCSHLCADLGQGQVIGESIRCPFHGWQYGADGRCTHIPDGDIPAFARQACYPVEERHGLIFFFNGPRMLFPLPFFDDCRPEDFVRARPFAALLHCPWYLVGANAFDVQHFHGAHDRRLSGPPKVDYASRYACRASAPFAVLGTSLRDRLTRWFGGDEVVLSITDWCGTLMYVTATFRRTKSYGMLVALPCGAEKVHVQGVVFVRRSPDALRRLLLDPLHLMVRRYFVKEFLRADAALASRGFRYNPATLLGCDAELARYFHWLAEATGPGSDVETCTAQAASIT